MENDKELEAAFHDDMLLFYDIAKQYGINATRFRNEVLQHGGVRAAKNFLSKGNPWDNGQLEGVNQLLMSGDERDMKKRLKRLQYTSEALVLKPQYRRLFTESERRKACYRLQYLDPSWPCQE